MKTLKEIKNTILNEFRNTKFAQNGGGCFECCDYENMYHELENFIFQKIGEAVKESLDAFIKEAKVQSQKKIPTQSFKQWADNFLKE